jgi:hypothetical protein
MAGLRKAKSGLLDQLVQPARRQTPRVRKGLETYVPKVLARDGLCGVRCMPRSHESFTLGGSGRISQKKSCLSGPLRHDFGAMDVYALADPCRTEVSYAIQ